MDKKEKSITAGILLGLFCSTAICGCKQAQKVEPVVPPAGAFSPRGRNGQRPQPPLPMAAQKEKGPMAMELVSSAFGEGERIPTKYTGDGADVSPPLKWSSPPEGTQELALIVDDPDAPRGTFTHWLLWGLPADRAELPEGVQRSETVAALGGASQGANDAGHIGYAGPAPPPGRAHRYVFTIYALDSVLGIHPGARKGDLLGAMGGHILATGKLTGTYGR